MKKILLFFAAVCIVYCIGVALILGAIVWNLHRVKKFAAAFDVLNTQTSLMNIAQDLRTLDAVTLFRSTAIIQPYEHVLVLINHVSPLISTVPQFISDALSGNEHMFTAYETIRGDLQNVPSMIENISRLPYIATTLRLLSSTRITVDDLSRLQQDMGKTFQLADALMEEWKTQPSRTYLVLLQNNMEIRPTGGFLGSYAKITIRKGMLQDIHVEDIYIPDGMVRGYIKPPKPVETYLFQSGGWKLRDANWDPDFSQTAQTIAWFYEKATGEHINGVIGTNLGVVQDMFKIVGSVDLPDYKQTVNADNLYAFAQSQTEHKFFPGSTNKTAMLTSLWNNLQFVLKTLPLEKKLNLFHIFVQSMEHADTTIWMENGNTQQVLRQLGWTGELQKQYATCTSANCAAHYLYLVEANVGINKTNCCVERTADLQIEIQPDGSIQKQLQLLYTNNNDITPHPPISYGGGYNNYLRVYADASSQLVRVNDHGNDTPLSTLDIESFKTLSSIGHLVEIPGKTTGMILYQWQQQKALDLTKPGTYTIYIQKQPGLTTNFYHVSLKLPNMVHFVDGTTSYEKEIVVEQNTLLKFEIVPRDI